MDAINDLFERKDTTIVLNKLVKMGWISGWGFHKGKNLHVVKWTKRGNQHRKWVNKIDSELELSASQMITLVVICEQLKPKKGFQKRI
jgi:hypothetical protein